MSISALPIYPVQTDTGGPPLQTRIIEEASQTFLQGVPLMQASGDGGIKVWDGSTTSNAIVGISYEDGHNFATLGPSAPIGLNVYTGLGASLTFGKVPNQSSASNIARGGPFVDGRIGFTIAQGGIIFRGMCGNNGSVATPAYTNVGQTYGMTIDSNSTYWYVDFNKSGSGQVVVVVGIDPVDGLTSGARILFKFLGTAAAQIIGN